MKVKDMMTLLGETMTELHVTPYKSEDFEGVLKKAEYEAKIAKQYINAADVTIRADKMMGITNNVEAMMK